jgi:ABC-type polysaccharide/polyol phosphate transport system ATPase subunit
VVSLLELAAGFSRDFSGRENIYLQGALYGMSKAEVQERIERIIAFSELAGFIDIPVRTYSSGMFVRLGFSIAAHLDADVLLIDTQVKFYSSGMYVRLAFSVAVHVDPEILLIDEVLAVGDEAFQRKCLRRISEQIAAGATVVLVSHEAAAIERVCERVVVLEAGRVMFDGPTAEGLLFYHRLIGAEHGAGISVRPHHERAVEVRDIELLDRAGRPATVFRSGDPLRIVAGLRARDRARSATLALELRGDDGARLCRTDAGISLDSGGAATLAYEIPALALLGGDYDLALGARCDGEPAWLDRTVRFSVVSESAAQGVIDLGGSWQSLDRDKVAP